MSFRCSPMPQEDSPIVIEQATFDDQDQYEPIEAVSRNSPVPFSFTLTLSSPKAQQIMHQSFHGRMKYTPLSSPAPLLDGYTSPSSATESNSDHLSVARLFHPNDELAFGLGLQLPAMDRVHSSNSESSDDSDITLTPRDANACKKVMFAPDASLGDRKCGRTSQRRATPYPHKSNHFGADYFALHEAEAYCSNDRVTP